MAAAGTGARGRFHRGPAAPLLGYGRLGGWLRRGFADGVRERQQIVRIVLGHGIGKGQSDDLPSARDGQSFSVDGAEVVRVRLGVGGQRAEDGGGVTVDIGQSGNRRPLAG